MTESYFKIIGYGLLAGAVVTLWFIDFSGSGSPVRSERSVTLRYPFGLRLVCAFFLLNVVLFAVAIAELDDASIAERVGLWSILGVPVLACSFEVFGKKIEIGGASISRTYFSVLSATHSRGTLAEVVRDLTLQMHTLRFSDTSVLRIPFVMQGSREVIESLKKKPNPESSGSP